MTSKLINNFKSNTKPHIDKVNRGHRLFKTLASKSAKEHHFCDFSLIQSLTKPQITGGQIEVYLCIRLSKKRGRRGCLALYIFNNRDRALTESMRVFGESNHHTTMLSFFGYSSPETCDENYTLDQRSAFSSMSEPVFQLIWPLFTQNSLCEKSLYIQLNPFTEN